MFRQQSRRVHQYPRVQENVRKSGLDRFSSSLDTFQQVLGMIQSTAPYIEKYGPVVQKLPTMYRMYRAIKNIDTSIDDDQSENIPKPKEEQSQKSPAFIGSYPSPKLYI